MSKDLTMPFGRYIDKPLAEIPAPYLRFVAVMPNLREPLASAVRDELIERGLGFGKHRGVPLGDLRWLTGIDLLPPLDELVRDELARRR